MPSPSQRHAATASVSVSHVLHSTSHDSGLTERSVLVREDGSEATDAAEPGLKRNVCPTGCGCVCRVVREYGHEEESEEGAGAEAEGDGTPV